jgi:phosphate:Na+ symporter
MSRFCFFYAVSMVRTGGERVGTQPAPPAFGEKKGSVASTLTGVGIAVLLQSSTATEILRVSFVSSGLMTYISGLAIILGADLGLALVVQILIFKLDWLIPILLSLGAGCF